ncbi:uncharacterized protein PHALS_02640 [Plasmopara halstedii]|uniref:Uncharacterized protein n=1 Tax=Plasmopara halstedii TaxID=4781 RepID=A0A0P1AWN3_PLAHL|nr:uncharacterized protein PHALS_02640 [Plasmopara halstedii]CEG46226.1 hypothetical protein PHALS_02640 [Plasmopara halstedii]|eukprot:XP_024582595.1 hypothetical protein PHALS_02640 [Plasmopara halstedii]
MKAYIEDRDKNCGTYDASIVAKKTALSVTLQHYLASLATVSRFYIRTELMQGISKTESLPLFPSGIAICPLAIT